MLQRFLHRTLDLAGVAVVFHVDKVDNDQPGHIAQAQLAGNLSCGFKVRRKRGLLDAVFFGRAARVDVDRNKRFGRVDDNIATRF